MKTPLSLLISILLLTSCHQEDLSQDLPPGPELNFTHTYTLVHQGQPASAYNDQIIFSGNGTYTRTETTTITDPTLSNRDILTIILIDDLRGTWKYVNGALLLTDHEIRKMRCQDRKMPVTTPEHCDLEKEDIGFGKGEWFEGFEVWVCDGEVVVIGGRRTSDMK